MAQGRSRNFLGLAERDAGWDEAGVVVLPVPYEATVTFRGGTRDGPRAILDASRAVELYDHELDDDPSLIGVFTHPELTLTAAGPEPALGELRGEIERLLDSGKFLIILGGEHTVSVPAILAHAGRLDAQGGRRLSVLQLDAHADLRESYDGTAYSHACAMRRVMDRVNLVQVGVRSLTAEERALIVGGRVSTVFAEELEPGGGGGDAWIAKTLSRLGEDVYLTIDVDYFDPALVPSTGTPEPGGGWWYPTLRLLDRLFRERRVVGADVVELAPVPGLAAPDFLVARLVYRLIGLHRRRLLAERGT